MRNQNEKKTIEDYISDVKPVFLVIGLVLLLGGAFCGAMALRVYSSELPAPVAFDALESEPQRYCYVDAIGVSGWVYRYDSKFFYILENTDHQFCVAAIPDKQIEAMGDQRAYWQGECDEAIPARMTGIALKMTDTMKSNFMQVLGISDSEFDRYFGFRSFAAGTDPKQEQMTMWQVFASFLAFSGAAFLLAGGLHLRKVRAAVRRLEQTQQLSRAAVELESSMTESLRGDRLRLGAHFVFGRHIALAAPYEDVIWCYERDVKALSFVSIGHMLVLRTVNGWAYAIDFGINGASALYRVMNLIKARNPQAVLGFSRESRRLYKERRR